MRFWGRVSLSAWQVFVVSALVVALGHSFRATPLQAAPLSPLPLIAPSGTGALIVPVVVFGHDARRPPERFAAEHGLDAAAVARSHAASGLIQCGNAHGAGQITLADDVVTTAAHVFYDENGFPRARTCSFDLTVDGGEVHVPIEVADIVAGSTRPYDVDPAHDWAVARLAHPVAGVKPYGIATDVHENEAMTFVARGHIDWGGAKQLSMQDCTLHDHISDGEEGTREFSFDCDTGDGASGGALMFDGAPSLPGGVHRGDVHPGDVHPSDVHPSDVLVGGVLVGWRSNRPFKGMPFSHTHYNFAVTLEGAFRDAVYAAARKMIVQK